VQKTHLFASGGLIDAPLSEFLITAVQSKQMEIPAAGIFFLALLCCCE
jgi:hypothetical protein